MSSLQNSIAIGTESNYGTPVTPTQAYEATGDDWQLVTDQVTNDGYRRARDAVLASRVRSIQQGVTGSIPHAFLTSGELPLIQACFGTVGSKDQNAFSGSSKGSGANPKSYTVQVIRSMGTSTQAFTYVGCVVTSWEFSVEVGGSLMFTPTFDGREVTINTAATAPENLYEEGERTFPWTECVLEIDDTIVAYLNSFSLSADLGFNTERRFLKGSHVKEKPIRSTTPEYSGELSGEFIEASAYQKFAIGKLAKIVFKATSGKEAANEVPTSLELTIPRALYTAVPVTSSISDLTTISMSFMALAGSDPAVSVKYTTEETE